MTAVQTRALAALLAVATMLTCACSRSPSPPAAPAAAPGTLQCKTGPAIHTVAGAEWLLYACGDGRSVVLMTQEGHPSYPYYLMIVPGSGGPRLIGEGWDRAQATNEAYAELSAKLNPAFVAGLHAEATAAAAAAATAAENESIQIQ